MKPLFSQAQGQKLVRLARRTLESHLAGRDFTPQELWEKDFEQVNGVFVTLHKQGELRGCIGNIVGVESVFASVQRLALEAALQDPRFAPLAARELPFVELEVSILTNPQPISGPEAWKKIRPFLDGVVLQKGARRATFLPQVWDQLPQAEEFFSQLSRKAGLAPNAWKEEGTTFETYQVQHFNEEREDS